MDPVFAESFKYAKSKGGGDFTINYMFASLNKEAMAGEFFFDFEEKIWDYKLVQCFEKLGAGQVSVMTFENNDGNESAANALLRLHTQENSVPYERGTCQPALHAKLQSKLAEFAKAAESGARELDEKTQMAIKQSLADLDGRMETTRTAVTQIGTQIGEVQNGVCSIIPDYQKEIEELKTRLAHKTKECDRIEGQKAHLTRVINSQDARIEIFQSQAVIWTKERAALLETESILKKEKGILLHQLEASKIIENAAKLLEDYEREPGRKRRIGA